jgi:hypothetical protein
LELDHPQVPLSLVAVEGDGEVVGEADDVVLVLVETQEEAADGALLGTAAFAGAGRFGVELEAVGEQRPIAGPVAVEQRGGKLGLAVCLRCLDRLVELDQERGQLRCPRLAAAFLDRGELAEVVAVAEGVGGLGVAAVGGEAVVDDRAGELGQDAERAIPSLPRLWCSR